LEDLLDSFSGLLPVGPLLQGILLGDNALQINIEAIPETFELEYSAWAKERKRSTLWA